MLDAADQSLVQAEMEQRYPVLAQHGFPVSKIMLWQRAGGTAVFITAAFGFAAAGEVVRQVALAEA